MVLLVRLIVMTNMNYTQADSTLALVKEDPTSEISNPPFAPLCLNVPDANIIIRSSDEVNFRVHKTLLSLASPVFKRLLSPQPYDGEFEDGLPVLHLSEDAGLVNSLVSLLYPVAPVIPGSYEKVFALLAACRKYHMSSIQSYIRAEVKRGTFPAPVGVEAFRAYAIASSLGLVPEKESAARLTLGHPMTFESLGDALRSFKGPVLRDLVRYRKRCRDNLVMCLDSFVDDRSRCKIWERCNEGHPLGTFQSASPFGNLQKASPIQNASPVQNASIGWPHNFFASKSVELKRSFTNAIFLPSNILEEFLAALKKHSCDPCFRVYATDGTPFCRELEDELTQALDKVNSSFRSSTRLILTARMTSCFADRKPYRLPTHPASRHLCCLTCAVSRRRSVSRIP